MATPHYWSSGEDPELEAQFLDYVREYEEAPFTTLREELLKVGCAFKPPSELDDAQIASEIERLAYAMAELNAFLESTDHLSDRRLYEELWNEMGQPAKLIINPDSVWHFDFASSGSDEDTDAYLRYYADESDRTRWAEQFPEYELPPQEIPAHPRPWLPQSRR
jgi:hypothetical protein